MGKTVSNLWESRIDNKAKPESVYKIEGFIHKSQQTPKLIERIIQQRQKYRY